jgi:uncharacterized protein (DUF488 family)
MEAFIGLLRQHGIEVLADVRSAPYSRYVPHFNARELKAAVTAAGLQYVYLGRELGGRPAPDSGLYDAEGHALYGRIAETEAFRAGITRLKDGAARYQVAMMCSEEDPTECHRRQLVGRVLAREQVELLHIRGDGRIDREADLPPLAADAPRQASLFGAATQEDGEWRSIRSVLPRSPRDSSSTS